MRESRSRCLLIDKHVKQSLQNQEMNRDGQAQEKHPAVEQDFSIPDARKQRGKRNASHDTDRLHELFRRYSTSLKTAPRTRTEPRLLQSRTKNHPRARQSADTKDRPTRQPHEMSLRREVKSTSAAEPGNCHSEGYPKNYSASFNNCGYVGSIRIGC